MTQITTRTLTPAFLLLIGLVLSGVSQAHDPQGPSGMGPGMMAPGYGHGYHQGYGMGPGPGYHMGQGMMGGGYGGHHMGHGMMGPGYRMGPGYHMGPSRGMGPGMMGPGYGMRQALPSDLSADQVRHMLEHQLAWQGNPNIKLGKVEEKDDDTIVAEIVTNDGSLVDRFEIDRHTGQTRRPQ